MDRFIVLSYPQQNNKIPSSNLTFRARVLVLLFPSGFSIVLGELKGTASYLDILRLGFDAYRLVSLDFSATSLAKREHKL